MSIIDQIRGTELFLHNGKVIDLLEIFDIDPEDLSDSYVKQASLLAYFSTLQADAERKLSLAKFDVDQEYAKADEYYRHKLDRNEKKYTEAVIRSMVIRDESYAEREHERIQLEYDVNLLKAITRSLGQRGDMLISLGALTRQEMSMTGMTLKKDEYDDLPTELKTIIGAYRKSRSKQV